MTPTPPHAPESETTVLGGVLMSAAKIADVSALVQPQDFYHPAHRSLFAAMVELDKAARPIDTVTVAEQMRADGTVDGLASLGGTGYLVELMACVVTVENIAYHARLVRTKADRRRYLAELRELLATGYGDGSDEDFFDEAERVALRLTTSRREGGPKHIKTALRGVQITLSARYERKDKHAVTGVPTGFTDFDAMTLGLQPGDLVIIAARPSMGKTAAALNVVESAALAGVPSLVFSLEMSEGSLVERLVSANGAVDGGRLRSGILGAPEWMRIERAFGNLSTAPIWIDDQGGLTVSQIRGRARRWRMAEAKTEHALIVVDYLQLMGEEPDKDRSKTRERRVAEMSAGLKSLAKDLRCPVLLLAQLNRGCETRADKRPMMSDIRESGSVEQDADVIAFLYRDEVYNPESRDKGTAEVIVSKQRNGPVGVVRLGWKPETSRFVNLSNRGD